MDLSPPRGTSDLLPEKAEPLLELEGAAAGVARLRGFRYVETPTFESTELFARTSGESSDVVQKEMYTFEDKGGRSLTLKPEGTAPVMRAYLQNEHDLPVPFKAFYLDRFFRHGRPQAGRMREFRQFGIEIIGTAAPGADVEAIAVADEFLRGRGITRFALQLNSIGDEQCRPAYREVLVAFLERNADALCEDCRVRIGTNPLRTFDCKEEGCRFVMGDAPVMTEYLCADCAQHFDAVKQGLGEAGIPFALDPRLVRGLDYYTRTAFEFLSETLSQAQATVCGGGRYDGLAEVIGGRPLPGVGFGMGLERVLIAMEEEGIPTNPGRTGGVFVVTMGARAADVSHDLLRRFRAGGIPASSSFEERSLKAQLRMADKAGVSFAAILGEREAAALEVTMRDLATGAQTTVAVEEAAAWVSSR